MRDGSDAVAFDPVTRVVLITVVRARYTVNIQQVGRPVVPTATRPDGPASHSGA